MDKDNLDVGKILFHLNHKTVESERSEVQQQAISALLMMCLGLVLTVAGLVVVLLRLMRLLSCSVSLLVRRPGILQNRRRVKTVNKSHKKPQMTAA